MCVRERDGLEKRSSNAKRPPRRRTERREKVSKPRHGPRGIRIPSFSNARVILQLTYRQECFKRVVGKLLTVKRTRWEDKFRSGDLLSNELDRSGAAAKDGGERHEEQGTSGSK